MIIFLLVWLDSEEEIVIDILNFACQADVSVAVRADRLLLEPLINAMLVEPVFADWHLSDFLFFFEIITADRADFLDT